MAVAQMPPLPSLAKGRYRHYKGREYKLIDVARHSETLEPLVVYQPLYAGSCLWVRPAGMWDEMVTVEGVAMRRFQKID